MLATPDPIRRQTCPLERWERLARAEEADRIAQWVIARRALYGLEVAAVRKLDRWIDFIWAAPDGVGSTGVVGATCAITPVDVLGGAAIVGWFTGNAGITVATGISNWSPTFGACPVFAQALGPSQPLYTANDSTLYGRGSMLGDGVDDFLNSTVNFPFGTTQTYKRLIVKLGTWVVAKFLCGGGSAYGLNTVVASPQIRISAASGNTTAGIGGAAVGVWSRVEALFYTGPYFLKCGATEITGTFALSNDEGPNYAVFARSAAGSGSGFMNVAIAEMLFATGITPTALQRALLDGITASFYKGTVSV